MYVVQIIQTIFWQLERDRFIKNDIFQLMNHKWSLQHLKELKVRVFDDCCVGYSGKITMSYNGFNLHQNEACKFYVVEIIPIYIFCEEAEYNTFVTYFWYLFCNKYIYWAQITIMRIRLLWMYENYADVSSLPLCFPF